MKFHVKMTKTGLDKNFEVFPPRCFFPDESKKGAISHSHRGVYTQILRKHFLKQ